jgi:hypothetical protein
MEENLCLLYICRGFITRIYVELKKLNYPQINDPIKKWANELNRAFSKEEIQMAKTENKKHMKMPGNPGHKTV